MSYPDVTATDPNKALLNSQVAINQSFNLTVPTATAILAEVAAVDARVDIAEADLIVLDGLEGTLDAFSSGFVTD